MHGDANRLVVEALIAAFVLVLIGALVKRTLAIIVKFVVAAGTAAIGVGIIAVVAGVSAVASNNVSLTETPGAAARVYRFLTVDWAATSQYGRGSATCREVESADAASRWAASFAQASQSRPGDPASGADAAGDFYPELRRHSYPGIPPQTLLQLATRAVAQLPGWQIVKVDSRTLTLDCLYTTRLLGWKDEVKVIVTPRSEVDLCSQSRVGMPGSDSMFSFFHGDFGANIAHIKQFYAALGPGVEQAYRDEQSRRQGAIGH
jgi:Protein of unknown function (DUF1499)